MLPHLEAVEQLNKRVSLLEGELRAAKRRETKLAATHFRLRQDLASAGGDLRCASATGFVHSSTSERQSKVITCARGLSNRVKCLAGVL